MDDIRHIHPTSSGFRDAYRRCAYDLHIACGGREDSFVAPEDEWYLDERLRILAWNPNGVIQAFLIYATNPFFYSDVDGEVLDIWVASAYRRKGVGRSLAVEAFRHLHGRVGLQVHAQNTVSLRFFESIVAKHGWEMDRETRKDGVETVWRLTI